MMRLQLPFKLPPLPRGRTIVVGAGRVAAAVAHTLDLQWPAHAQLAGLVVTHPGQVPSKSEVRPRVEVVEGSDSLLEDAAAEAARRVLSLVQSLTKDDLVICLVSADGSDLLTVPAAPLTLQDKRRIQRQLVASTATVAEVNCVIKHLSRIKGGWLAAACAPAQLMTFVISDAPGDDPSHIAFGPTLPDRSTCNDAISILQRYQIAVPGTVMSLLTHAELETPKPHDFIFDDHLVHWIATDLVTDHELRCI